MTASRPRGMPLSKWKIYEKPMQNPIEKASTSTNPSQLLKLVMMDENKRAYQEDKLYKKVRLADRRIAYIL